jgi:hypothetical protein
MSSVEQWGEENTYILIVGAKLIIPQTFNSSVPLTGFYPIQNLYQNQHCILAFRGET